MIIVDFRAVGDHDDQPYDHDQGQYNPHFDGFRARIENIVTHCSVDNKSKRDQAHQDGEFFQGIIPRLEVPWDRKPVRVGNPFVSRGINLI